MDPLRDVIPLRLDRAHTERVLAYLAEHHVACPGCGYDLHGVGHLACPECGRAFTPRMFPWLFASIDPETEAARLRLYLRSHDPPCPGCATRLGGHAGPNCPGCGRHLTLWELKPQGLEREELRSSVGCILALFLVAALALGLLGLTLIGLSGGTAP